MEDLKMVDINIKTFINDLASDKPAPGGGAVAAMSAALSGALSSMVYSLTVGKKIFDELSEEDKMVLGQNIEEAKGFANEALKFADKDKKAFNALMDAYKLPKETEDQKRKRANVIEKRTLKCLVVPLSLAEESLHFYENIKFAAEKGNKNLVSDAAISAVMLHSAIEAALINVKANLKFIKDEEVKAGAMKKMRIIEENNNILKIETFKVIDKYL